ncbi:hypothetical protein D3C76_1510170 [compost metagenome]
MVLVACAGSNLLSIYGVRGGIPHANRVFRYLCGAAFAGKCYLSAFAGSFDFHGGGRFGLYIGIEAIIVCLKPFA